MADLPPRPTLVRDGTVVATAVGVSDPSLTLVEFVDGVGFFLAESFQHDSFTGLDTLETVSIQKYAAHAWTNSERDHLVLCWDAERSEETEILVSGLKVSPHPWVPMVFFLTPQEYFTHRESVQARRPEQVLRAAFARATKVSDLMPKLSILWSNQRDALERLLVPPPGQVLPKKQTVRITLPPKPAAKKTARLELPPGAAILSADELAQLRKWLEEQKQNEPPEDPPPPKS